MSQFRNMVESILTENNIVLDEAKMQEMAYPSNFDLCYFSTIPTFKEREKYCRERLKFLGGGSSRIAFQVDDKKVLKIAKNRAGIIQNENEEDWGRNKYSCFAKIYEADKNHLWIEMELARKVYIKDFISCLGISRIMWCEILAYIYNQYSHYSKRYFHEEDKKRLDKFFNENIYNEKNKELYDLYRYMLDYQPDWDTVTEFWRVANLGVVNRNGKEFIVIIDDGLKSQ